MTRRTALWSLGVAATLLGLLLLGIDQRLFDEGGPGIVGFELAGTERRARDILVEWGSDGRGAARLSLWLDFVYLAAYGAFLALASLATRDHARRQGWRRFAAAGTAMAVLAVAGALFDAVEDVFLLLTLGRHGDAVAPAIAAVCALREDGAGPGPPLVLIHGFACSMRWWDRVVPALARAHRVIRVDLLGHGGSAKPRDGYSMQHQADLVASALRRLGVRRAIVVGHSMGGIVGTAMIRRHPGLVSRMMTIGTPPDTDSAKSAGPTQRLAFAPVIGPTVRRVVSDDQIRAELERTFIPRVDVPPAFVDDIRRTTFRSFRESGREAYDYRKAEALPQRLAGADVRLTAVDGSRDSVVDPDSLGKWRAVPGAHIVLMRGLGHSPQVEAPARTAGLILAFAAA
jgi:pimeloyl-ACP methyl ester carboxylesterase